MSNLLDRELTSEEQAAREALERAAETSQTCRKFNLAFREAVSENPKTSCAVILSMLSSRSDPMRRRIYDAVADLRDFWIELFRPGRFDRAQLVEVCRYLMGIDSLLDVRLAHVTPGRRNEDGGIDPEIIVRILDLLDAISPGPRLILLLNHLTQHSDSRVAAKATLLVGRRIRNPDWVSSHLDSSDGRVRASTVEGLWGFGSQAARNSLWTSLTDKNNRVVGNALIGLHQLGEQGVNEFVKRMIQDPRPPFRWTAAWVMGQICAEEFIEDLEKALHDNEAHVQRAAERSLEAILQSAAAVSQEASGPAASGELNPTGDNSQP